MSLSVFTDFCCHYSRRLISKVMFFNSEVCFNNFQLVDIDLRLATTLWGWLVSRVKDEVLKKMECWFWLVGSVGRIGSKSQVGPLRWPSASSDILVLDLDLKKR